MILTIGRHAARNDNTPQVANVGDVPDRMGASDPQSGRPLLRRRPECGFAQLVL